MNVAAGFDNVKGILCDLDGVLYVSGQATPGAAEAIQSLKNMGMPLRFVSNTTTKSLGTLHRRLRTMGLPVERHELITASQAGVMYLRQRGRPVCRFVLDEDARRDYAEFPQSETDPEYVVIGDIGRRWNFALVNQLFRLLMAGAEMIALHKGRFFLVADGLEIDTGAFVTGLEYATGKRAEVIGKPEKTIFQMALGDLGIAAGEALMVGDDLTNDVAGAQSLGIRSLLVKTGKHRDGVPAQSDVVPHAVIDGIADLPVFLKL